MTDEQLKKALAQIHCENCYIAELIMISHGIVSKDSRAVVDEWDKRMQEILKWED